MSTISSELLAMQNATAQVNAAKSESRKGSDEIGGDAFLMLMLEQLKNQDPTSPMDNKEFLTQQAQFTQLSEIQKLNANMSTLSSSMLTNNEIMQASSLIGKEVSIMDPEDDKKVITGTVTSANFSGSQSTVVVNGVDYPLGYVFKISQPAATNTNNSSEQSASADSESTNG